MVQISQELREEIRELVISDEDEALRLLELYEVVDEMCLSMENDLKGHRGVSPTENGHLRTLLREIHPMLRLRNDLLRELRYISRSPRREYEENQEDRRSEDKGVTPKEIASRMRKPPVKNRQHRNRVSKRHKEVSNESSTQN